MEQDVRKFLLRVTSLSMLSRKNIHCFCNFDAVVKVVYTRKKVGAVLKVIPYYIPFTSSRYVLRELLMRISSSANNVGRFYYSTRIFVCTLKVKQVWAKQRETFFEMIC